jgi:hypothetical protein
MIRSSQAVRERFGRYEEGQEREVWSGWRERLDRKRLTPGIEFAQAVMPAAHCGELI